MGNKALNSVERTAAGGTRLRIQAFVGRRHLSARSLPNLILQSDTGWQFSRGFVRIEADKELTKPLQTLIGMTSEDWCGVGLSISSQVPLTNQPPFHRCTGCRISPNSSALQADLPVPLTRKNARNACPSLPEPLPACEDRAEVRLTQNSRDLRAFVPLDLDLTILYRPTRAACLLHRLGQLLLFRKSDAHKPLNHRHCLAAAPCLLPDDVHSATILSGRIGFGRRLGVC